MCAPVTYSYVIMHVLPNCNRRSLDNCRLAHHGCGSIQFEDDDDTVDLPAGHMLDAEEVEVRNTIFC